MGLFDQLLGGQQEQHAFGEFIERHEQGAPSEGYSGQEVLSRCQAVAEHVRSQNYVQAAEQAFARMSPQATRGTPRKPATARPTAGRIAAGT